MMIAVVLSLPVYAAPVAVRFPEGMTHGFLLLRSVSGEIIGEGEIKQVVKEGDLVYSHLTFNFKDGSLHDEKVTFSQQHVFTLVNYRLVQRGPSFPEQIEISMDRSTSEYRVRSRAGEEGREQVLNGTFTPPKDAYNGIRHDVAKPAERLQRNGELSRLHAEARGHQIGTASDR